MPAEPLAFDRAVEDHQRAVLRICRSILRDEHLGADAAQETFLRLWTRIDERRSPEHFGAWLRRVAVTISLDLLRRRGIQGAADHELLSRTTAEDLQDHRLPEDLAARAELERVLAAAVETLPEGQRAIFLLRHSGALTLAQVADALGVSLSTVKTQFARACLKVQSALAPFQRIDEDPR